MDHPHFWFVSCFAVHEEEDDRILRNSLFDPLRGAIYGTKNENFSFQISDSAVGRASVS